MAPGRHNGVVQQKVGVIAIQGDFDKHGDAVARAGGDAVLVRTPEQLDEVDRIIIPGGESTTVGPRQQDAECRFGGRVWA